MQSREPSLRINKNRFCQFLLIIFLSLNLLTYLGAYGLTHFRSPGQIGFGMGLDPTPVKVSICTAVIDGAFQDFR